MVCAVVQEKLAMVIKVRHAWPMFVSIDEDESLRKSHWNEKMGGKRIRMIMHDMTDVPIDQPGDSELNRATFSKYYGGNCGKGGIFTQLCGWEGTLELFTGGIGDSEYVEKSRILQIQNKFATNDPERDGNIVPFLNVFEKGYRVLLECHKEGEQLCWQPVFRKSDERYSSRSGNERSVKHVKHSSTSGLWPSSIVRHSTSGLGPQKCVACINIRVRTFRPEGLRGCHETPQF